MEGICKKCPLREMAEADREMIEKRESGKCPYRKWQE